MLGVYRLFLFFALAISVSACSQWSWWGANSDETFDEDYIVDDEAEQDKVVYADEEVVYVDEDGNVVEVERDEDLVYVDEDGNVVEIEELTVVVDDYGDQPDESVAAMTAPPSATIYFDYKQFDVPAAYIGELQQHADYLRLTPSAFLNVEGYTDGVASEGYNYELGLRRAREVADILIDLGAPRDQLAITSYGEERPAISGSGSAASTLNRRVVLVYS